MKKKKENHASMNKKNCLIREMETIKKELMEVLELKSKI